MADAYRIPVESFIEKANLPKPTPTARTTQRVTTQSPVEVAGKRALLNDRQPKSVQSGNILSANITKDVTVIPTTHVDNQLPPAVPTRGRKRSAVPPTGHRETKKPRTRDSLPKNHPSTAEGGVNVTDERNRNSVPLVLKRGEARISGAIGIFEGVPYVASVPKVFRGDSQAEESLYSRASAVYDINSPSNTTLEPQQAVGINTSLYPIRPKLRVELDPITPKRKRISFTKEDDNLILKAISLVKTYVDSKRPAWSMLKPFLPNRKESSVRKRYQTIERETKSSVIQFLQVFEERYNDALRRGEVKPIKTGPGFDLEYCLRWAKSQNIELPEGPHRTIRFSTNALLADYIAPNHPLVFREISEISIDIWTLNHRRNLHFLGSQISSSGREVARVVVMKHYLPKPTS